MVSTACDISKSDGQTLSRAFGGVISVNAWPAAREKVSPYWTSANAWRRRKPALVLVTAMVPEVAPLKSISK